MMTGCDLSAITKPWEVQSKVGGLHSLSGHWLNARCDIGLAEIAGQKTETFKRDELHSVPDLSFCFLHISGGKK